MWILLVEDEKQLADSLKRGLEEEGYVIDVVYDGEEAEYFGIANEYDLVILDWRLPKKSGKKVLEIWRSEDRMFPVLLLTAFDDLEHKVEGLDSGADDYMSKPFSFDELLARIRALGRRAASINQKEVISLGPITMDFRAHLVTVFNQNILLRQKEFLLLELLVNNPETIFSKSQIAERIWGSANYISDNTIEATVSTLRQKLDDTVSRYSRSSRHKNASIISTKRGVGYQINNMLLSEFN